MDPMTANPLIGTVKDANSSVFINSSSSYTASGNYIKTLRDGSGNTITNNWDETKGLLSSNVDAKVVSLICKGEGC